MASAKSSVEGESPEIHTINLPAKLVRECVGFSIDIGGSVIKVVCRTREDYKDAQNKQGDLDLGQVHLAMFPRKQFADALAFAKDTAYITRDGDEIPEVFTTGVGSYQFKGDIEKALNIRTNNLTEGDCIHHSFLYLLKRLPMKELVLPFEEEAIELPIEEAKAMFGPFVNSVKAGNTNVDFPGIDIENLTVDDMIKAPIAGIKPTGDPEKTMMDIDDIFPMSVGMFGSAFGLMKIDKDEKFSAVDLSLRGGRACLALASLLVDCKDFDEFIALAEQGNSDNVDSCTQDLAREATVDTSKSEEDDLYSSIKDDKSGVNPCVFALGQAAGKSIGDFKKADLARALLRFFCNDLIALVHKSVRERQFDDINHVFIGGGFPANTLTRKMLTHELATKVLQTTLLGVTPKSYQVHFLRHGPYLCALGCLINSVEHFM